MEKLCLRRFRGHLQRIDRKISIPPYLFWYTITEVGWWKGVNWNISSTSTTLFWVRWKKPQTIFHLMHKLFSFSFILSMSATVKKASNTIVIINFKWLQTLSLEKIETFNCVSEEEKITIKRGNCAPLTMHHIHALTSW